MAQDKSIIRTQKNRENPYVMIDKTFLSDDRLSWKAKGLLSYFLSKPDDWTILVSDLIKRSTDGEKAVRSGLKELEKLGYLENYPVKDERGRIKYWEKVVYERPNEVEIPDTQKGKVDKTPDACFPHVENVHVENGDTTNNDFTNKRSKVINKQQQPVVVDDSNSIKSELTKYNLKVNAATLKKWRKQADDATILQVIGETIARSDVKNIIAYITKTLEAGYVPVQSSFTSQVTPSQTKQESKYDPFREYYGQNIG